MRDMKNGIACIAGYFLSDAADAFSAAFRLPNFLQNLFGEGVLSASLIPVYARLLAEGEGLLVGIDDPGASLSPR